ncbi:hypothetical protein HPB47_017943 [Ixodes persulcatus]|uniref:Uncharacterized protein n=1 Tax=Ixodes persulcatus TaxID=34615 RepID=A0AC60QM77_IXOPE|nr:hypothetical protein HPB47_017943 [Ixodes persulcatus]
MFYTPNLRRRLLQKPTRVQKGLRVAIRSRFNVVLVEPVWSLPVELPFHGANVVKLGDKLVKLVKRLIVLAKLVLLGARTPGSARPDPTGLAGSASAKVGLGWASPSEGCPITAAPLGSRRPPNWPSSNTTTVNSGCPCVEPLEDVKLLVAREAQAKHFDARYAAEDRLARQRQAVIHHLPKSRPSSPVMLRRLRPSADPECGTCGEWAGTSRLPEFADHTDDSGESMAAFGMTH